MLAHTENRWTRPDGRLLGAELTYREFLRHGIRPKAVDESLVVAKDSGVANVLVWIASPDVPCTPPKNLDRRPVTIHLKDGNYAPRLSVATVGQPVLVENRDPVAFNFHLLATRNEETSVMLEPRWQEKPLRLTLAKPETLPMRYRSEQGPWATGWLLVHGNPFAAVSGEDGSFAIPDLPPGE